MTPLAETLEELVTTGQAPAYVVHFTQAAAVEHATALLCAAGLPRADREAINARIGGFRFGAGFGKTLAKLVRGGHRRAPRRDAAEVPPARGELAQAGLLTVICGTDTLGVGINVPIRTVLFTGLAKFDGNRQRVLRTREFLQIAGRAGRPGYDTSGYVVVQAPEHVIENERAKAKSAAKNAALSPEKRAKKKSKPQLKKPPEGTVVWTEQTFDKLVAGEPERLRVADEGRQRDADQRPVPATRTPSRCCAGCSPTTTSTRATQLRLARRALRLARSLRALRHASPASTSPTSTAAATC